MTKCCEPHPGILWCRCQRIDGHSGPHRADGYEWYTVDPLPVSKETQKAALQRLVDDAQELGLYEKERHDD